MLSNASEMGGDNVLKACPSIQWSLEVSRRTYRLVLAQVLLMKCPNDNRHNPPWRMITIFCLANEPILLHLLLLKSFMPIIIICDQYFKGSRLISLESYLTRKLHTGITTLKS